MSIVHLSVILFTVFLSACAQLLLKIGVTASSDSDGNTANSILSSLFSLPVLGGLAIYAASVLIWLWVLSKVELSLAYPFVGLSFIFTLLFGHFVLNETVNTWRIFGTFLIILGCFFVARS